MLRQQGPPDLAPKLERRPGGLFQLTWIQLHVGYLHEAGLHECLRLGAESDLGGPAALGGRGFAHAQPRAKEALVDGNEYEPALGFLSKINLY